MTETLLGSAAMHRTASAITGVYLFSPTSLRNELGFTCKTFDAPSLKRTGINPCSFVHDEQYRTYGGVVRGLHGKWGYGEAKLVRCSFGSIYHVVLDARPDSPTFGKWEAFRLDDQKLESLYMPRGVMHGFQALTEVADVCMRLDNANRRIADMAVRYDDPYLNISWPLAVQAISSRDAKAPFWGDMVPLLLRSTARITL